MNTNLENFYQDDAISFYLENPSQYTDCDVYFINSADKFSVETILDTESNTFKFNTNQIIDSKFGDFSVYAKYSKIGEEKTIYIEDISILESVLTAKNIKQTYEKKMLGVLDDKIAERFRTDYSTYSIGGRSITKMDVGELLNWRKYFADLVSNQEAISGGFNNSNKIIVRYTGRREW